MHRSAIGSALVLGLLVSAVSPAEAQWAEAGFALRARAAAATTPLDLQRDGPKAKPRTWPYLVGGALLGGLIMTGGIVLALDGSESLTRPLTYAPAVAGAAIVGAGTGYLVYCIRF